MFPLPSSVGKARGCLLPAGPSAPGTCVLLPGTLAMKGLFWQGGLAVSWDTGEGGVI